MTPQERAALVALVAEIRAAAYLIPDGGRIYVLAGKAMAALAAPPAGEPVGEPTPSEARLRERDSYIGERG